MEKGEVILYQPNETTRLEVRLEEESVWLTQAQIAELFGTEVPAISKHIRNIYQSEELYREATVSKMEIVRQEGNRSVRRILDLYNLDMILSIGYRVNGKNATLFRQWANRVLKDYLLRGYTINNRLQTLERTVAEHSQKIEFFIKTALPPVEGIFYDGQIFDAYKFVTDLIKSANQSLVLIDNYVDEATLLMLSKRKEGVNAIIYTQRISQQLQLDIEKHNAQYPPINIKTYKRSHDRFILIDGKELYHIGASLKDLGKKIFAFSKMNASSDIILQLLPNDFSQ